MLAVGGFPLFTVSPVLTQESGRSSWPAQRAGNLLTAPAPPRIAVRPRLPSASFSAHLCVRTFIGCVSIGLFTVGSSPRTELSQWLHRVLTFELQPLWTSSSTIAQLLVRNLSSHCPSAPHLLNPKIWQALHRIPVHCGVWNAGLAFQVVFIWDKQLFMGQVWQCTSVIPATLGSLSLIWAEKHKTLPEK
jgi:hypothetical protein